MGQQTDHTHLSERLWFMKKTVNVEFFDPEGVYLGEGAFEFDSKLNKPRRTFMPDAQNAFRKLVSEGSLDLGEAAARLRREGGTIVLRERYGYPVLIHGQELFRAADGGSYAQAS